MRRPWLGKLTEAQRIEAAYRYLRRDPVAAIAADFDITQSQVVKNARRYNCKPDRDRRWTQEEKAAVAAALRRGDKYDVISLEHHMSIGTISSIAKRIGLPPRRPSLII